MGLVGSRGARARAYPLVLYIRFPLQVARHYEVVQNQAGVHELKPATERGQGKGGHQGKHPWRAPHIGGWRGGAAHLTRRQGRGDSLRGS